MNKNTFLMFVLLTALAGVALADDPPAASSKPWTNSGELSVVSSNGNSKATRCL
jgi:putative salt-induced outer membrane protein YdiY